MLGSRRQSLPIMFAWEDFRQRICRRISQDEVYTIVRDIYNSTIFSDIVKRNQVRKIDQLERVVKYTFNNVGNTFSAKSIADYLKAEQRCAGQRNGLQLLGEAGERPICFTAAPAMICRGRKS